MTLARAIRLSFLSVSVMALDAFSAHAQTIVQFGINRGTSPNRIGVYDSTNTFQPFMTMPATGGGPFTTLPSTTSKSGFNITPGVAPTLPNNGDMWTTNGGLYVRINGATVGPLAGTNAGSFAATFPLSVTFPSGIATYAINYNSTLTVDGSNKLGINLGNTNTWAATQTFPNASITNAELANPSTTVNGVPCTLGSTCAITATVFINAAHPVVAGTSYTPILPDGTDQTAHLLAVLDALEAANIGAEIDFPTGIYLFSSAIVFPNSGGTNPVQPTIIFKGAGATANGILNLTGTQLTGTIFDLRSGDPLGMAQTYGTGLLKLEDITLTSGINSQHNPFFYSTYTTILGRDIAVVGSSDKCSHTTPPDQDAFVFGGTSTTLNGGTNAPFQGYGSSIDGLWVNNIRRAVYGRVYSNHVHISHLTTGKCVGSNLIGAISFTGTPIAAGGTGYVVGDLLTVSGGTFQTPTLLKVASVSAGVITGANVFNQGNYTTAPSNPVSVTGGTGTGATFNLTYAENGSAVEIDVGVGGQATGWTVQADEIEMTGYAYAVTSNAEYGAFRISVDDVNQGFTNRGLVHFTGAVDGSYGMLNSVLTAGSAYPGVPLVVDDYAIWNNLPCGDNVVLSIGDPTSDTACLPQVNIGSLTAGNGGGPNNGVLFNGGAGNPVIIKPTKTTTIGSSLLNIVQATADGTNVIQSWLYGGGTQCNGQTCGDIANTNGGYGQVVASWTNNGRTWSANGTGGAMEENSGTGGSRFYMDNYAAIFREQDAATQVAEIGPIFGGGSISSGIGFGTTNQVSLFYNSGSGLLQSSGPLATGQSGTLGGVVMGNATSGTITLQPVTGALGTDVASLPAATDTIVELTQTQTLTNKTLTSPVMTAPTLGVATGTSLALGGATLGTNALAVAGSVLVGPTAANAIINSSGAAAGYPLELNGQLLIYGSNGSYLVSTSATIKAANLVTATPYTVATLPTPTTGMRAFVNDATTCTLNGTLTGSGSTPCPVWYNGSAWVGD